MFNQFEKRFFKYRKPLDEEAKFNTQIKINAVALPYVVYLLAHGWPEAFFAGKTVRTGEDECIINLNMTPEEKLEFDDALTSLMGQPLDLETNPN